jgi:plasminogen activator inhibitor 1 RNA-binding protein
LICIVDNKGFSNNNPRPAFNKTGDREERNNRRNREMNGNVDFEKPRTGGNGSAVGQRSERNQNQRPRNFDGRKRERDRQSGSDKTGVKSVDKRDGGGAHNWGNPKQDIDDMNKATTDDENKEGGEEVVEDSAPAAPVEEEPKEMTLDEWKAQRKLLQPTYNLRKAGEGEDNAQWDKMKRLDKKAEEDVGRKDDGTSAKKEEAKKKQVLDIEFHFNDGRRGGLGRRGGPGGGRGGAGGPGGPNRRPRPVRENNGEESHEGGGNTGGNRDIGGAPGGEHRERRPPRRPRFENRRDFHGNDAQNAPKVDDERDFPSLG